MKGSHGTRNHRPGPVVELLYIDECPNRNATRRLVMDVLQEEHIEIRLVEVCVRALEDAVRHRFIGSPSVRINGEDIEQENNERVYNLGCRVYRHDGTHSGVPPKALIQAAVRRVK